MRLTENQRWILNLLSDNGGRWRSGVPRRSEISRAQMMADIAILNDKQLLKISGPVHSGNADGPHSVQLWLPPGP